MNTHSAGLSSLRGRWSPVAHRSYGTSVYRVDGPSTYYVKTAPAGRREDFRFDPTAEAARLRWLRAEGFPVPEVIDVGGDDRLEWLVTAALPGVPASARWTRSQRRAVVTTLAGLARELHSVPMSACPFDGSLRSTLPWARRAVTEGLVDLDDLDPAHHGWSAERLLAELTSAAAPDEDLVICHGDLCLDNVLVDPETQRLTGVLDVGRLGVADRWRDLAVLLRNLRGEYQGWDDHDHAGDLLRGYGTALDDERLRFYFLLDEFF